MLFKDSNRQHLKNKIEDLSSCIKEYVSQQSDQAEFDPSQPFTVHFLSTKIKIQQFILKGDNFADEINYLRINGLLTADGKTLSNTKDNNHAMNTNIQILLGRLKNDLQGGMLDQLKYNYYESFLNLVGGK